MLVFSLVSFFSFLCISFLYGWKAKFQKISRLYFYLFILIQNNIRIIISLILRNFLAGL